MLDSTSRRTSPTAASAVSASAAVSARVSTSASGRKSSSAPRRWGRSCRSACRWSASGSPSGSCSPRCTSSSSWPYAASSSTIAAPMNRVPPSTTTRIRSHPPRPVPQRVEAAEAAVPGSVTQAGELLGVALPLLGDLDVQVQEDPGAEQRLQLGAGGGADLAQQGAAATQHDRLLAGPLHEHGGVDHQQVLASRGGAATAGRDLVGRAHLLHH